MQNNNNNRVATKINEAAVQLNKQIGDQLIALVIRFLDQEGFEVVSSNTVIERKSGAHANLNEIRERFVFYHLTKERPEGQLKRAFDLAMTKLIKERIERVNEALKYTPEKEKVGEQELRKWIVAVTGLTEYELEYKVMRHFLWQVKRKLNKKLVQYHLMPILYGRIQGSGKSTAIRRLLDPISSLTLNGKSIDFVTDEKNYKALGDYFVCFFDEMSGMDKADESALKQIITADQLAYRVFYTQASSETPQNCTFIGSSNRSVIELIKDTTGARRFFELRAQDRFDYEVINSIDYSAIWTSIDENAPALFYESSALELLKTEQEQYKRDEAFTEWLSERNYIPVKVGVESIGLIVRELKLKDLWADYKDYSQNVLGRTEMDAVHRNIFAKKLRTNDFDKIRRAGGDHYIIGTPAINGSAAYSSNNSLLEKKGLTKYIIDNPKLETIDNNDEVN